ASTWSWLTQDRNVSGFTPSWSPIRRKIPRRAPGSASRASRTMRTALSRSSRGYFFWGMTGKSFPWLHCLHYSRGESVALEFSGHRRVVDPELGGNGPRRQWRVRLHTGLDRHPILERQVAIGTSARRGGRSRADRGR